MRLTRAGFLELALLSLLDRFLASTYWMPLSAPSSDNQKHLQAFSVYPGGVGLGGANGLWLRTTGLVGTTGVRGRQGHRDLSTEYTL